MSVVLLKWKSDESVLSASTRLLKQSKLSSVPLSSPNKIIVTLLSGCPVYVPKRLQKVQNSAAKLVFKSRKRDHVKPLLQDLHWLPVQARVDYKLSTITTSSLTHSLPTSLTFSLCTHLPDNFVLLQTHGHFASPMLLKTKTFGQRSFSYSALKQWNYLPSASGHIQSSHAFKTAFKDSPLQTKLQLTRIFHKHFSLQYTNSKCKKNFFQTFTDLLFDLCFKPFNEMPGEGVSTVFSDS